MKRVLIGLIVGLAAWPIGVGCYFLFGNPPVAVADNPLPMEPQIAKTIRHRRINRQQPKSAPIQATEDNMMAGAQIYTNNCAACHGMYNETSTFSQHMYPSAPQLWQVHGPKRVIGVSHDPVGEIFWKVSNGIRLSGMPAFRQVLTPNQIWEVTVLLANSGKPLPPEVKNVLMQPMSSTGAVQPQSLNPPLQPGQPMGGGATQPQAPSQTAPATPTIPAAPAPISPAPANHAPGQP